MIERDVYRILYFSGTGNTHWVMKALAERLEDGGCEVEMLSAGRLLADLGYGQKVGLEEEAAAAELAEYVKPATTLLLGYPAPDQQFDGPSVCIGFVHRLRALRCILSNGEHRLFSQVPAVRAGLL
jgi:hypothetical protein